MDLLLSGLGLAIWTAAEPFLPINIRGPHKTKRKELSHYLHLYTPCEQTSTSSRTLLIFVHGGHGQAGTIARPEEQPDMVSWSQVGQCFASNGYRTALVGYPLCPTPIVVRRAVIALCLIVAAALIGLYALLWWAFPSVLWVPVCVVVGTLIWTIWNGLFARLAPPVSRQTAGATLDSQIAAVIESFHRLQRLPPTRVVIVGHGHGALLATHAISRMGGYFSCAVFMGISGIYDLDIYRSAFREGLLRTAVDRFYLQPLGKWKPLDHLPLPDNTLILATYSRANSEVVQNQLYPLRDSLKTRPRDSPHQAMASPLGMGRGIHEVLAEDTRLAICRILSRL